MIDNYFCKPRRKRLIILWMTLPAVAMLILDCLSVFGAEFQEKADEYRGQAKQRSVALFSTASTVATLLNGSGDGSVTISVDAYGSFGSSTPAGNAIYDPIGGLRPAKTTFESGVYFGPLGDFLTSDSFGAALPPIRFSVVTPTFAESDFQVAGFQIQLTQQLSPIGPAGSTLVQKYRITNKTGTRTSFNVVRHIDGDLFFVGDFENDFAGVSADGRRIYEFDTGDDPSVPTTYFGITSSGGVPVGFTVQPFRFTDRIRSAKGIPSDVLNKIFRDANGNRITDTGYDVTLSLEDRFNLGIGETKTYITETVFGQGATSSLAFDVLDPNRSDSSQSLLDDQGRVIRATTSGNISKLTTASLTRLGVAADGVTKLVLRVQSESPITFSIASGDLRDGSLTQIGSDGERNTSVAVDPVQGPDGRKWAFALYTAPIDFETEKTTRINRPIEFKASRGTDSVSQKLSLERPPVVLVHGVWSSDEAWKGGLYDHLKQNGIKEVFLANYGGTGGQPAGSFDPLATEKSDQFVIGKLATSVELALDAVRKSGVAATQVDVIGHSMGGLVARARVVYNPPRNALHRLYLRKDNFNKGEFHKIITVGTPHKGTPFADWLLDHRHEKLGRFLGCRNYDLENEFTKTGRPFGPAIEGFRTSSLAIQNIGKTDVPSHAIIGVEPAASDIETFLNKVLDQICEAANRTKVDIILGQEGTHDTIVPVESQRGGLGEGAVTRVAGVVHAPADESETDVGETRSLDIWNHINALLGASVRSPKFGAFPALSPSVSGVVDYLGARWMAAGVGHFTPASRGQADVTSIVIHTTEDASYGAAISWFQNTTDPDAVTSSHYIVQRDGSVVQLVRERDIAHHAGTTGISASWTWNQHSIGIEVERLANATEGIANAQYSTVKKLVDSIRNRFNVPLVFPAATPRSSPTVLVDGIVGHGKTVTNGIDPVNWDWAYFQALFNSVTPTRSLQSFGTLVIPGAAAVAVRITPSAGTVVRAGDTIQINIETTGSKTVKGVRLIAGRRVEALEGPGPFSIPYKISKNFIGKLEISAEAVVSDSESYSGATFIIVQPIAPIVSITVFPTELPLTKAGQQFDLSVSAQLANGATIDISSSEAGTSYSLLSASTVVASISPNGLVEARGPGQDTVLISNSGKSTAMIVSVVSTPETQLEVQPTSEIKLNRQSGLYEQVVQVSNLSGTTIDAVRVIVRDLPQGAQVYNATGAVNGEPYLQYNHSLGPGEKANLNVEYYVPGRRNIPLAITLVPEIVSPSAPINPVGSELNIMRSLALRDGSILIEFTTLSNRTYFVQYSADGITWKTALPSIMGTGNNLQWIDSGPPKTDTSPASQNVRFYRIIRTP